MSIEPNIDKKFHRAVDIVQSLPKGGPIQTTYEEKLWLYSLYKQATEGDIKIPRPGMLDLLGKAKWDSWHKQEGITKTEAKAHYVEALCKILERNGGEEGVEGFLSELEGMSGLGRFRDMAPRPASPASSTSSYHSSQASPPLSPGHPPRAPRDQNQAISLEPSSMDPQGVFLPPDPLLPPPDVGPSFVPPSALTSSHRSLLSLSQEQEAADTYQPLHLPPRPVPYVGSRAQSSRGDPQDSRVVKDLLGESGPGSVQSFRQRQGYDRPVALDPRAGSRLASPSIPPPLPRDYVHTPEMQGSPFAGLGFDGTPIYQSQRPPGPGSASTYGPPPPLNISYALQQIQTSLAALHERLSTLERTQWMILRSDGRKKSWLWWSTEGDDLDQAEAEAERERWGFTTVTRQKHSKKPLSSRVIWFLLKALRRVLVDAGVGAVLIFIVWIMLNGGVRRARVLLGLIKMRARRLITGGR
ncbi:hypothetical protein L198_01975 [Cryptococcus wingfieldii CBS 7118]|uniref:ACB domain-containing protein n=1 Tax=Cryptococcus wingfieldii CBS 7118 TaxID=1295528 RepID=A0A1E3JWV8_9TREE|nr:hypothetical protein L198_01975 [Cryptococcus wingfieldii CBS 7118]ODO05283.1 hypothetical protein L198_01975 [Cryptococcus wingfieldii CBS 7118]